MLLGEQIEGRREVGRIDEPLLFGRQVTGEARDAVRAHPDAAVRDFHVFEDVRLGELVLLALRRLGLIRTQGRDVDQSGDAGIHAGMRDNGAADGGVDIAFQRVQAVLRRHHLVTLRTQRRDELLET